MRGGDACCIRRLLTGGAVYKRRISALRCGNLRRLGRCGFTSLLGWRRRLGASAAAGLAA